MATKYQIQAKIKGTWIADPDEPLHETMTEAELAAMESKYDGLETRIRPIDPLDTVKLSAKEAFKRHG